MGCKIKNILFKETTLLHNRNINTTTTHLKLFLSLVCYFNSKTLKHLNSNNHGIKKEIWAMLQNWIVGNYTELR